MDKLDDKQQARAVALDAASRIIAENLGKFINLGSIPDNETYTELAVTSLAKRFEVYIEGGAR